MLLSSRQIVLLKLLLEKSIYHNYAAAIDTLSEPCLAANICGADEICVTCIRHARGHAHDVTRRTRI